MGLVDGEDFNSIRAKGQERIELYETGGIIQFFGVPNNLHHQSPSTVLIIQSAIRTLHVYFFDINQSLAQITFRHIRKNNLR